MSLLERLDNRKLVGSMPKIIDQPRSAPTPERREIMPRESPTQWRNNFWNEVSAQRGRIDDLIKSQQEAELARERQKREEEQLALIRQEEEKRKKEQGSWFNRFRKNPIVQIATRAAAAIGIMATLSGPSDKAPEYNIPSTPNLTSGDIVPSGQISGYTLVESKFTPVSPQDNFIVQRAHPNEEPGRQAADIFQVPKTAKETRVNIQEGGTLLGALFDNGFSADDLGATVLANKDTIEKTATEEQRIALEQVTSTPSTLTQKAWKIAATSGHWIQKGTFSLRRAS